MPDFVFLYPSGTIPCRIWSILSLTSGVIRSPHSGSFAVDALLLLALNLPDALFRRRQVFRHGAAQLGDGLSDLPADLVVGLIGLFLAPNVLAAQLFVCLRSAEQVSSSSVLPM